jgi:outer membrane lipoprotein-sorting protein
MSFKNPLTAAALGAALAAAALINPVGLNAQSGPSADEPAAPAVRRGLEVAVEADRRDAGFNDLTANLLMTLRNAHGEESVRELRNKTLEVEGDGDKTLVIFDQPRDVAGTAFLNYTHTTEQDDQWLYLPALRRVKRISSSNRSGPFMGSEFAYEDISSQEVEKYTYAFVEETTLDGQPAFLIERTPVDEDSGYTRQLVYYDQAEYRLMKIDFYDRKNELQKTLTYHDYQQYLDQFWRAARMEMVNHQTGKSTTLTWTDYQFRTGLTDRDFDQSALQRIR